MCSLLGPRAALRPRRSETGEMSRAQADRRCGVHPTGAYVDATDGRQERPIAWAQALGHTEVVELFLAAGAPAVTAEEVETFQGPAGHHRVEIKPFLQF